MGRFVTNTTTRPRISLTLYSYVPPDQEGLTSGNKLAKKHPLGSRARHLHTTGALIVRFEMPFAVWCTTCKPHETLIGQGVRFNAEKKKVGSYHSTPVWSFRMKHTACGGWIEIRTDPKNTAYVVVEGGRKRDTGEDKEPQPGEIAIRYGLGAEVDPAEKDPFAKLEGKVDDKRRAQTESSRILELQERQKRDWNDPYEKSRRLRRTFRTERKGLERLEANREALKEKMSLGIDLVDETEADRQRAGMVDFGDDRAAVGECAARATRTRPMFEKPVVSPSDANRRDKRNGTVRQSRTKDVIAQRKASLRHELTGNTRAAVDPFLNDAGDDQDVWRPGAKRKRPPATAQVTRSDTKSQTEDCSTPVPQTAEMSFVTASPALVAYASDTD